MGNVIQIKRGSGIPGKNALKNGELGYDQTNKRLYIGDRNGNAVSLAEPPLPHTVLTKPQCYYVKTGETDQGDPVLERRECSGTDRILRIICSNLQSGKTYKIYLYTEQRYRGHAKHRWRHPHNDEQYTAEGALKTGAFTGFLNIAGTDLPDSKLLHPDVPDWMEESGRGGVLQTEWEFTPTSSEHVFDLQLNKWLVDLMKWDFEAECWVLMGVANHSQTSASRRFQFKIVPAKGGKVGTTEGTLCVGSVTRAEDGAELPTIGYCAIK